MVETSTWSGRMRRQCQLFPRRTFVSAESVWPVLRTFASAAINTSLTAFLSYFIHENACRLIMPKAGKEVSITQPGNNAFIWS